MVASYFTPSEFLNLLPCCVVNKVECIIRVLERERERGVRTSFDVGSTITGTKATPNSHYYFYISC